MFRLTDDETGGVGVAGELYRVDEANVGRRIEAGGAPHYRGEVTLADEQIVWGILYPRVLAEGHHRDISAHGDWRAYLAAARPKEAR